VARVLGGIQLIGKCALNQRLPRHGGRDFPIACGLSEERNYARDQEEERKQSAHNE
jgi:hypothetical protein